MSICGVYATIEMWNEGDNVSLHKCQWIFYVVHTYIYMLACKAIYMCNMCFMEGKCSSCVGKVSTSENLNTSLFSINLLRL